MRTLLLAFMLALVSLVSGCGSQAHGPTSASGVPGGSGRLPQSASTGAGPSGAQARGTPARSRQSSFAVGLRTLDLIDRGRTITLASGGVAPRRLLTEILYPALGPPGARSVRDAPAAHAEGPFPLIVFGHGFAVTPDIYRRLLESWTSAGYVVAAPVFPLGSAGAPGGPNEADLPNQPADMRYVITRLLRASGAGSGPLAGLIDRAQVAVAGQSDGGDTALAVGYDRRYRDPRLSAAAILSGAEIPGIGSFAFPAAGPPLLAVQGTADTVNTPAETSAFFDAAARPKYLLLLPGAHHLLPYTNDRSQLAIVERVTIAFFDAYLAHRPGARQRLLVSANAPGRASLLAEP